jgi:micrococcal nuclease
VLSQRSGRPRRAAAIAGLLIVAASLVGCAAAPAGPPSPLAEVIEVTDGDTIVVRSGPHTEPVRLLGIDTPEVAHHGQSAECFGPEAAERTATLLPVGSTVRLDRDEEGRDAYDRVLAYVTTADGVIVNLALAAEGFATPLAISPNYALADTIAALSSQAAAQGLGLWGACPPEER